MYFKLHFEGYASKSNLMRGRRGYSAVQVDPSIIDHTEYSIRWVDFSINLSLVTYFDVSKAKAKSDKWLVTSRTVVQSDIQNLSEVLLDIGFVFVLNE